MMPVHLGFWATALENSSECHNKRPYGKRLQRAWIHQNLNNAISQHMS